MDEWIKKVNEVSRKRSNPLKINKKVESMYKERIPQKIKDSGIIESNTIIAKFMGYEVDDSFQFFYGIHYYYMTEKNMSYSECTIDNVRSVTEGFVCNYVDSIERRYDNHWDILMPVVDKIEELGYDVFIKSKACMITRNSKKIVEYKSEYPLSRIELVYETVVKFIKWYNEQEK